MKTWIDPDTKLEWMFDVLGHLSWDEMELAAARLGSNWRVPTIKELLTLVDYSKWVPAVKEDCPLPFENSSYYWSSTNDANDTNYAWYVDFYNGRVDGSYKTDSYYVRCVRNTVTD